MNKYSKYVLEIAASIRDGEFALSRRFCDACMRRTIFLISGAESRSIRCLGCRSTAISLAALVQIKRLPLDAASSHVYEMSYHGAVYRYLQGQFPNFHFSEYFGPPAGGVFVNGVRNEDVQRLSFEPETFHLVSSTEVFEHVPDYMAGFAEVHRVLRPGGWFVFTVPFFDAERTKAVGELTADGRINWLGEAEYHDSQVTGVGSVPVFWHHSMHQLPRDLLSVGFSYAEVVRTSDYSDRVVQHVVVARR